MENRSGRRASLNISGDIPGPILQQKRGSRLNARSPTFVPRAPSPDIDAVDIRAETAMYTIAMHNMYKVLRGGIAEKMYAAGILLDILDASPPMHRTWIIFNMATNLPVARNSWQSIEFIVISYLAYLAYVGGG